MDKKTVRLNVEIPEFDLITAQIKCLTAHFEELANAAKRAGDAMQKAINVGKVTKPIVRKPVIVEKPTGKKIVKAEIVRMPSKGVRRG